MNSSNGCKESMDFSEYAESIRSRASSGLLESARCKGKSASVTIGLGDSSEPKCHRYVVEISDTDLLPKSAKQLANGSASDVEMLETLDGSSAKSSATSASKVSKKELRFYCKLKDMWSSTVSSFAPRTRSRQKKLTTGDQTTDRALSTLELQGYSVQEVLSRGQFSDVVMAYSSRHNKNVVLKLINKNSVTTAPRVSRSRSLHLMDDDDDISNEKNTQPRPKSGVQSEYKMSTELRIHNQIKHKNIVDIIEYFPMTDCLTLVLEHCENGNFQRFIKALPGGIISECVALRYFKDMVTALEYIHWQNIAHLDINLKSFNLDHHNRLKMGDFRTAVEFRAVDGLLTNYSDVGTPGFTAPEILGRCPYNPRRVDVWCLGAVLFTAVVGKPPFHNSKPESLLETMQRDIDFKQLAPSVILSEDLRSLLGGILSSLTDARFTINRIRNTDWFVGKSRVGSFIGNFFLLQQPQKCQDSAREKRAKIQLEI